MFLTQILCYFINHRRLELIKHSSILDEADGIQNEERVEKIKNMFAFIRKSAELCSIELKEWINVDNISPWMQFAMEYDHFTSHGILLGVALAMLF